MRARRSEQRCRTGQCDSCQGAPASESPSSSAPAASPSGPVNVSALDTGSYSVTPRPGASSRVGGWPVRRRSLARRCEAHPAGAYWLAGDHRSVGCRASRLPRDADPGEFDPGDRRVSCEGNAADPDDPTSLRNAVLRVADPGAATSIAQGLAAGGLNMPPAVLKTADLIPTEPIRAVPVPGHPEATGILLVHREGDRDVEEVITVSAHGSYGLIQVARSAQGPDAAAALTGHALDQQVPLIDGFVSTDPAQFCLLPLDPTGLLARTVTRKAGQGSTMSDATFDRAAALQLEDDPLTAGPALDAAAVDVVAPHASTVIDTCRSPSRSCQSDSGFHNVFRKRHVW